MNQDSNQLPSFEEFESQRNKQSYGVYINPKRVISNLLRLWYVMVASLLLAFFCAWAFNRYTKKLYHVQADIMIKEAKEVSGPEILYNNVLIDQYRNFYNELHFIRSIPLLEQVVSELKLNITFSREGNIKDSEVYGQLPVNIKLLTPITTNCSFDFILLNESSFKLKNMTIEGDASIFQFGDTIVCNQLEFVVEKSSQTIFGSFLNRDYVLAVAQPNQLAKSYSNRLTINWAEQGASVINISLNGYIAQKEKDFLDRLISVYSQHDLDRKSEAANRTIEFIKSQLTIIADSLSEIETQLELFKDENYITDLSAESTRIFALLEHTQQIRSEILIKENYYHYLETHIKESQSLDQIILPTSIGVNDPILVGLINQMVALQLEAKTINRELKGNNPKGGIVEQQIADIKSNILESVKELRSTDVLRKDQMDATIKGFENQLRKLPGTERELIAIKRNYNLLEGTYIFLMQKLSEASISRASTVSDIIIINPPTEVGGFITPKPTENYAIALLLGLFVPIAFVVLLEIINDRVQSKDDITRVTNIPFSGAIGHNKLDNGLVVNRKPRSSMAEAFRSLRSNLNYFTGEKDKKVYLVTSSVAGEGKTFTSINLGTVFAMTGKKTLLVGADLRRPKIHVDFGLVNDVGLSNYLVGQIKFEEIIKHTDIENLDIIGAGAVPPNPSELIMRPEMAQFIEDAKKHYDIIIIDSPPVGVVTDAFILTLHTDHNLFIVRQNYTPMSTLKNLDDVQSEGKLGKLSIVLNDIQVSRLGYGYDYGYNYGYGYRYYSKYGYGKGSNGYYED